MTQRGRNMDETTWNFKLIEGGFCENEKIIIEIDGKQVERKVKYNRMDGLYIIYKNRKYFESECDYDEIYRRRETK